MKHTLRWLLRVVVLAGLLSGPVYSVYVIWKFWPQVYGRPARK